MHKSEFDGYHILVVCGYAGSGKSTFIEKMCTKYGYNKVSSSDALHEFTELLWKVLFNKSLDTHKKDDNVYLRFSLDNIIMHHSIKNIRKILIGVAEDALKKVFGSDIFVNYQINKTNKLLSENKKVILETIGSDEFDIIMQKVNNTWACYPNAVKFINLRSERERPDVDGRTLISGGYDLWYEEMIKI